MNGVEFDYTDVLRFVDEQEIDLQRAKACEALEKLQRGTCEGADFLGWLDLPDQLSDSLLNQIERCAEELKARTEVVVVIGIGGSYLGAKAVMEALSRTFKREGQHEVLFAGHHLSEDYLYELQDYLRGKRFGICVISKSGTTTEPAIAFRLLKEQLEEQVGKTAARACIVAITDARKGALRQLADQEKYTAFMIPDNVGGRFSVLTPVGLLPIALAGFSVRELVRGASVMRHRLLVEGDRAALNYAAVRHALYRKGYSLEIMVNYNPKLHYVGEWWKQLFGESEGKAHKGIFPASVDFTTDLHSMGQYIQDGARNLFETVLSVAKSPHEVRIPRDSADLDRLNYLAGKRVDEVNKMAELGTRQAHVDGGVPNMRLVLPELSAYYLGQLFYFYELACGISGGMLGVNTFDQPGVEDYKRNMFTLLGKPGYK